jgi:hypothetical protein
MLDLELAQFGPDENRVEVKAAPALETGDVDHRWPPSSAQT